MSGPLLSDNYIFPWTGEKVNCACESGANGVKYDNIKGQGRSPRRAWQLLNRSARPDPRPSSLRTRAARVAIRYPRPNSRPSSFVPATAGIPRLPSKGGGSNGGGAPLAVRRGPGDLYGMVPRRVFSPFLRDEKWGRPQAKRSRPVPVPARGGQSSKSLRIRRLPLRFATLVPSPPAGLFLCRQRKRRKKPLKGTYFEAVPLRIPPRRPRGLRPPLDSPLLDGGRGFTKDEGQGCPLRRG